VDRGVGRCYRPTQTVGRLWRGIAVVFPEDDLHSHLAGDFTGGVAAHPIADDVKVAFAGQESRIVGDQVTDGCRRLSDRAESILVRFPHLAWISESSF